MAVGRFSEAVAWPFDRRVGIARSGTQASAARAPVSAAGAAGLPWADRPLEFLCGKPALQADASLPFPVGGRNNGAPGERPYHPGCHAALVLDPDGNNVEAVYHGEARRSAPSVTIDF